MQITETPQTVEDLDLMKRLHEYADGRASWTAEGDTLGNGARRECTTLYSNILSLVHHVLTPLLDRVHAREMETFTLHDRRHALKVAHLMWHILEPGRQTHLTPPEIAMLVLVAYLHDLGMGLSPEERQARLTQQDLWERLEWEESARTWINGLREKLRDPTPTDTARARLELELFQAEEALLCRDTRERHASPERYRELLERLAALHEQDRDKIPDIDSCLTFDGDSFREKLLDICVSHNEDAEALLRRDATDPAYPRFPGNFPVGSATADLLMVGCALRLSDILDFDRERTPPALFLYLMPGPLSPEGHPSVLEWGKHLAISQWHIEENAVVFRGRSRNHIIHHVVVQFCASIAEEIEHTKRAFETGSGSPWPFRLPCRVDPEIHAEGYRYVPYRFELDDQRIYELLMGGAIYDNPLVAVRELVQNAVDACKLRDALTQLHEPWQQPSTKNRIFVRYEKPTQECLQPRLSVRDTGTGMDEYILKTYFLKVGQSYYRSAEFDMQRFALRKGNLDFAPVSEFGIGFLSCFLLADRVKVETAMAEGWRGDTRKRTLLIDGPTRLIRLDEEPSEGPGRWKGTQVTLYLSRGGRWNPKREPPRWGEIRDYLEDVCQELPYDLHLQYDRTKSEDIIPSGRKPLEAPPDRVIACRIPVNAPEAGLEGEVALLDRIRMEEGQVKAFLGSDAVIGPVAEQKAPRCALIRGGFKIGLVPSFEGSPLGSNLARIRLTWQSQGRRRYLPSNLARNEMPDQGSLGDCVARACLKHFLDHREEISGEQMFVALPLSVQPTWDLWLEEYDAWTLYQLGRKGWVAWLQHQHKPGTLEAWEAGEGKPLKLPTYLPSDLLEVVLPAVATLQLSEEGVMLLKPPKPGWAETLKGWRSFIRQPVEWSCFAEFVGVHAEALGARGWRPFYATLTHSFLFNEQRREMLRTAFNDEELSTLCDLGYGLVFTRLEGGVQGLTPARAALWSRLAASFGEQVIGGWSADGYHSWRVDSFKIGTAPESTGG